MANGMVASGTKMVKETAAEGNQMASGMMSKAGYVAAAIETEYDEDEVEINGHITIIRTKRAKLDK